MDLIREKVFVNRYHYDVRNHEWEKENGVPKTNVEVTSSCTIKMKKLTIRLL